MIYENEISRRLQSAMKVRGVKLSELAKESSITLASISRYVKGERVPSAVILGILAITLNVSCDYLLGITDGMNGKDSETIDVKKALKYCEEKAEGWSDFGDRALANIGKGDGKLSSFGAVSFAAQQEELYAYHVPRVLKELSNYKEEKIYEAVEEK
jgi:transcriptional regulator with XRE-family HTH domain